MVPTKRSFVEAVDQFTKTQHKDINPTIDPSLVNLPSPFSVCILGASEGIGASAAFAYAKAGASDIIISARSTSKLEIVAKSIHAINPSCNLSILAAEVTSSDSVATLAGTIKEKHSRLDVVVLAFGYSGPIHLSMTDSDPVDIAQCFSVNAMGTYHAAHHLLPLLLSSPNGAKAFLAIGSVAGSILTGPIANFGYCTSKMTQARLVEFLAEQYREEGLLAVSIHPGAVLTPTADISTPTVFRPYLVDDVGLAGGACVWLTKGRRGTEDERRQWLSGRFICATWDFDDLVGRKQEVVDGDLLTWRMVT